MYLRYDYCHKYGKVRPTTSHVFAIGISGIVESEKQISFVIYECWFYPGDGAIFICVARSAKREIQIEIQNIADAIHEFKVAGAKCKSSVGSLVPHHSWLIAECRRSHGTIVKICKFSRKKVPVRPHSPRMHKPIDNCRTSALANFIGERQEGFHNHTLIGNC